MKTPDEIVREVAAYHCISVAALKSKSKVRQVVHARWEAMWRIRHELLWTLASIGMYFDGRDHSVVFVSVERFDDLMDQVPGLAERMAA